MTGVALGIVCAPLISTALYTLRRLAYGTGLLIYVLWLIAADNIQNRTRSSHDHCC